MNRPDEHEAQSFSVFDEASGKEVIFNPKNFLFLGTTRTSEEFNALDVPEYNLTRSFYKQGEITVVVESIEHNFEYSHVLPEVRTTDLRSAILSLVENGISVPAEIQDLVADFEYCPSKNVPTETGPALGGDGVDCRLRIDGFSIWIDKDRVDFAGGPKTKGRLVAYFSDLMESRDYVTMKEHALKTRDIEAQDEKIKKLLEDGSSSASGFRIKKEWFSPMNDFPF